MFVLVDSSVWMSHYKCSNEHLMQLWDQDELLCHPLVIGEIACGTPPALRKASLSALHELRKSNYATIAEVTAFIDDKELYGAGCGIVDISLLTSTLITPDTKLWTLDKRLRILAKRFHIDYIPPI